MRTMPKIGCVLLVIGACANAIGREPAVYSDPATLLPMPPSRSAYTTPRPPSDYRSDLYSTQAAAPAYESDYWLVSNAKPLSPPAHPARDYYSSTTEGERYINAPNRLGNLPQEQSVTTGNEYLDKLDRVVTEDPQNLLSAGCAPSCTPTCDVGCAPCTNWFGGVYALYMGRDHERKEWFSYYANDIADQRLLTRSNWAAGGEVRFGRWFCCNSFAIEAVYWGLSPSNKTGDLYADAGLGGLGTVYDFGTLRYSNALGTTDVNYWFDDSEHHRLTRSYQVHNVEINFLNQPLYGCSPCSPFRFGWSAGIRYFRFDEGFAFMSSILDPTFGVDPTGEMWYTADVKNSLVGFQIGCRSEYQCGSRWSFDTGAQFGIYNNHINMSSFIGGHNGAATVNDGGPFQGRDWDLTASKDDVSLLAELRLGLGYRIGCNWRLTGGYRIMAITGLAMANDQIPRNFAGINDVVDIDSSSSMILHGGYLGLEYTW